MGDLMYHFKTDTPFGIYGGAGLGAVNTNIEEWQRHAWRSTVFGWQAIGGVEYLAPECQPVHRIPLPECP